jgi:hypothetical protein
MHSNARAVGLLLASLVAFHASPALASVITTDGYLYPVPGTGLHSQNSVQFNPVSIDLIDPGGNRAVISLNSIPAGGTTVFNQLVDLNHTIRVGPPGSEIFVDTFVNVAMPVSITAAELRRHSTRRCLR